jgi:NAD(P)-dependent dehydrogenase (short-subunit alcohol dehydrogenase family)
MRSATEGFKELRHRRGVHLPKGGTLPWIKHRPAIPSRKQRSCCVVRWSERANRFRSARHGTIGLIKAEGRIGLAVPGDLRDEKFCQELVARAREGLGGLDIIVNNAARQQSRESILDVSSDDFDATMKTNIYAPFWIIKAALPHLKPGAVIIGTSSEQAYDPSPELYDYAQTKAATMNYVKSLAKQLGPKGIRVNAVAPGPIWTPLQVSGGASMEKLEKFGGHTPLGRPGQPVELASIYVQLAASDASYANGQVYGSSGGAGQP